jgi:hypothetical protein
VRPAHYAALVLVFLLLPPAQSAAQAGAQNEGPITKERFMRALKEGKDKRKRMTKQRLVELICEHRVNFQLTPEEEKEARKVGAYYEKAELDEIIAEVQARYHQKPTSLSGAIERVEVAARPGGGAYVFIRLLIKNDGAPSVAQKYYLRVSHVTSKNLDFRRGPAELKEPFTLAGGGGSAGLTIYPHDSLARKTDEAVGECKKVSGWLRFVMPPLPTFTPDYLRQLGTRYVVSFTDANGKTYEADYEVR